MKVNFKSWVSTLVVVGPLLSIGLSSQSAIAQTAKLPANSSAQVVVGEKLYQQNLYGEPTARNTKLNGAESFQLALGCGFSLAFFAEKRDIRP